MVGDEIAVGMLGVGIYQLRIEPGSETSLVSGTTNQVELNINAVASLIIPLPPLAEQHRIVAKVDELMQLCDQLEHKQNNSLQTHRQLVSTLLTKLTEATDSQAFQAAWSRIAAHFDSLFTTESSIEQLKQTILQFAVMGKLVPQNPNDEPADELLKKIATEKARLITEGKIKNQTPLPKINEDEKPFALPNGWEWTKPDNFSSKITDGEHFRPITSGIYFLSAKDIRAEGISIQNPLYISDEIAEKALKRCNPEFGDLL